MIFLFIFFFSSRRRHTRSLRDWSSDVCSSDLLGFGSFEPTLALLLKDAMHLSETNSFLVFAYVGFVLVMTQGFLYRRLAHRYTEPTFMAAGITLMALGLFLLGGVSWLAFRGMPAAVAGVVTAGAGTLWACLLVSLALAVVGFALLTPSAQALISRRSD